MKQSTKWLIGGGTLAALITGIGISHAAFHHKDNWTLTHASAEHHDIHQRSDTRFGKNRHDFSRHSLKTLDANQDKNISKDEVIASLELRFNAVDSNQDGFLSNDEFTAHHIARFERIDTDQNDVISLDEWPHRKFKKGHSHTPHNNHSQPDDTES